jgi:hypothetical protein
MLYCVSAAQMASRHPTRENNIVYGDYGNLAAGLAFPCARIPIRK